MNLRQVREAVSEEAVVRIFSTLVTAVNNMADVVGEEGPSGSTGTESMSEILRQLEASNDRVSRLNLDPDTWESMKSGMAELPDSWSSARALLTKRLVPEIIASAKLILSNSAGTDGKAAIMMLKQRLTTAQSVLTGMAPVGQAAADAVDEQPDASEQPAPTDKQEVPAADQTEPKGKEPAPEATPEPPPAEKPGKEPPAEEPPSEPPPPPGKEPPAEEPPPPPPAGKPGEKPPVEEPAPESPPAEKPGKPQEEPTKLPGVTEAPPEKQPKTKAPK